MALDLQPGDEVITADFTFIASAEVVALLGLKLVLVDVDPNTYNISIEGIRKAITSKTKAIIPVHLFGQCANMEEIMAIAKEHNLYVVEDSAQATGADFLFSNGERKKAGQTFVGFAAETDHVKENATEKLKKKHLDMIVANDVTAPGAGFNVDTNIASLITKDGTEEQPLQSKRALAEIILDRILTIR